MLRPLVSSWAVGQYGGDMPLAPALAGACHGRRSGYPRPETECPPHASAASHMPLARMPPPPPPPPPPLPLQDVANAFAPSASVGAKALTLRQALVVACEPGRAEGIRGVGWVCGSKRPTAHHMHACPGADGSPLRFRHPPSLHPSRPPTNIQPHPTTPTHTHTTTTMQPSLSSRELC